MRLVGNWVDMTVISVRSKSEKTRGELGVTRFVFNPNRVAELEAEGWRAYYDRKWARMLSLMTDLSRQEFNIPFFASLFAAFDTIRAARRWAPAESDFDGAKKCLGKFYRKARQHSGLRFDPDRAAELEVAYWDIARRLKQGAQRADFVRTVTQLHSEVFGISPEQAAESAELRVQANELVNEITQGTAEDPETNWLTLKQKLRECYGSIDRATEARERATA
jgi:hypothetical protein